MSIRKTMARATVWSAIDAADDTISTAQYDAFDAEVTTITDDILVLQGDITDLEALSDIIASDDANNTAAVVATGSMPDTVATLKVVDENGATIGYVPIYENADLSVPA